MLSRPQNVALSSLVHPHWLGTPPPPQVLTEPQLPQLMERGWPQASVPETTPQVAPMRAQNWAFVSAAQLHVPDWQVFGLKQVPQLATVRLFPHESRAVRAPQLRAFWAQKAASVSAVHPHMPGRPSPPHVLGPVQVPQLRFRARPQRSTNDCMPQFFWLPRHSCASVSG